MKPEEGRFNWVTFQGFLEQLLRRKYRTVINVNYIDR